MLTGEMTHLPLPLLVLRRFLRAASLRSRSNSSLDMGCSPRGGPKAGRKGACPGRKGMGKGSAGAASGLGCGFATGCSQGLKELVLPC